jgi:protoporphyrinogen oxidase
MNVVIGAGITGLSAAQELRGEFVVLEREARAGGLAGQYRAGGFAFDHGGHYFHFQGKPEVRAHVERFRPFREFRRDSRVFLGGRFIPYSLQYHLAGLPARLRRRILNEMLAAPGAAGAAASLHDHLLAHFGPTLLRVFFAPYMEKFYRLSLAELIPGMDKGSIPVPSRSEVLAGARRRQRSAEGYNPVFYYPRGGLQGFIDAYAAPLAGRVRLGENVVAVDAVKRRVITAAGSYRYENLVSTVPLNRLLGLLRPAPPFERRGLRHLSTLVANAVLARRRRRYNWAYLAERRFPFYRAGYYPAADAVTAYLERTVDADVPLDERAVRREAAATLRATGMIDAARELLFLDLKTIPVSYVVFDRQWPRLVPAIHAHLRRLGIHAIGRYGSWNYTSMADDVRQARETARQINRS